MSTQPQEAKRKKVTIHTLNEKKAKGEKITYLTAYDYQTAVIEDRVGVDLILVGDSLGMCVYGFDSTLPVTLDIMINHAKAVRKGAPNCFVIGDMPYMTYQVSIEKAVENAGRLVQGTGVDGIKLEGGSEMCDTIRAITRAGIPVMGHLGLTPQSASMLGGFKAQGRDVDAAVKLVNDAKALEDAGCFAILLEAIPAEIAQIITERAKVPILGIGAGKYCDGQVLIVNDLCGFYDGHIAKFVKQYANVGKIIEEALTRYKEEVEQSLFPEAKHCYKIDEAELAKVKKALGL
ncbi:MAG: 3-methyl-2-oxobutanoate hydroxymethyltransferase [Dethiobacter sp.]|jgi:3-methyl-2-oxobutanoate hydroxymethyltransferase|nr:3-methyl-2-oxobutanoate hydroxymethyltransferase [Dethiobacter sp.]